MLVVKILALIVAFLASWLPAASGSTWHPACAFDAFEPQALFVELSQSLPAEGIAVVNLNKDPGATNTRSLLMRGNAIVGELFQSFDARAAKSEMTVLSADGDVLLHFDEKRGPCLFADRTGLCTTIAGYTELEPQLDGKPAYVLELGPDEVYPTFYRYDVLVPRLEYKRILFESLEWLVSVLDTTDVTRIPVAATPEEQIYWSLAGNPAVAPYLERLTIETRSGRLILRGVVPSNFVYGEVVGTLTSMRLWTVVPDLIIDTRTGLALDPRPTPSRCL